MLAGMFLTLGTSIAVMVAEKAEHMLPGSGKFFYSFMFAWSLVMINYMNTELGTSNMMYMTAAVYRKKSFSNFIRLYPFQPNRRRSRFIRHVIHEYFPRFAG